MTIVNYKYTGLKDLPKNGQWHSYFIDSKVGNTYKCLVDDENNLVMSNTEVEIKTNQPIVEKAKGDVLLIGLGINLINDKVLENEKVSSVDTIEINQWVIDNVPTKTNVLKGNYHTYPYTRKYDTIWYDAFEKDSGLNLQKLTKLLKPGGTILTWSIN